LFNSFHIFIDFWIERLYNGLNKRNGGIHMTLGDYIRSYRKKENLSQREFALKCNLSNGYISMLERGLNPKTKEPITPSLIQLKKIADGMGVTVNDILLVVDDMPVDVGLNTEKEQPAGVGELSAEKQAMYDFIDTLSEEQVKRLLQIARAAFER
jgi:transcriptional regulator with XRE-family HTH domain